MDVYNEFITILNIDELLKKNIYEYNEELILENKTIKNFTVNVKQEIFTDFLNDKDFILKEIYEHLKKLTKIDYKINNSTSYLSKLFSFINFIGIYIDFINQVNQKNNLDLFKSQYLISFIKLIKEINLNIEFALLINKYNEAKICMDKMLEFSILIDNKERVLINVKDQKSVIDELNEIKENFGFDFKIDEKIRNKDIKHFSYEDVLTKLYKSETNIIELFYKNYIYKFDYLFGNAFDIFYYFNSFKEFFVNFIDKEIPYCKANICNDDIIEMNEMYNIELLSFGNKIISNNIYLDQDNRQMIITGANGGGKTSFIRGVGINYFLFLSTGYLFCKSATLSVLNNLFTHFPNDELYKVSSGRFFDEVERINNQLNNSDSKTLIIMNESFSSTNDEKALNFFIEFFTNLKEKNIFLLLVSHNINIVRYMESIGYPIYTPVVLTDEENKRTYRIMISKDFSSYTKEILLKYGLTEEQLEKSRGKL